MYQNIMINLSNHQKYNFHTPVMVREVISYLITPDTHIKISDKTPMYIDATIGGGGHTRAILEKISDGIVVGIDLDIDAIKYVKNHLKQYNNFYCFHSTYTNIDNIILNFPNHYLKGILFDLGVSAYQISVPERGFSYNVPGLLDMRFDQTIPCKTAKDILLHSSQSKLTEIFSLYGEERYAKKIARRIYTMRNNIKTTFDLANLIRNVTCGKYQNKTLSRVFQSLRIVVNNELENIKIGLEKAIKLCTPGARIVVISYHSLEDRIAKQTFKYYEYSSTIKILTKKPLRPSPLEVSLNVSSHSARLRAVEKN